MSSHLCPFALHVARRNIALRAALPPSLVARDCHDYYGSSATSRRQQRTVRLPRTLAGSAGTAGTLPTFTHMPVGRAGASCTPGASPRATATQPVASTARTENGRPRRSQTATGIEHPHTAHSRQFPGCSCVSGLLTLIRLLRLSALLPHPARWRRTAARSSGAAPASAAPAASGCPPASPDRYGGSAGGNRRSRASAIELLSL